MSTVRMISIPEDLNRELSLVPNASKLIAELLYAYFKSRPDNTIVAPSQQYAVLMAIKEKLTCVLGRDATLDDVDDYRTDYIINEQGVEEWGLARKKQEDIQKQSLLA